MPMSEKNDGNMPPMHFDPSKLSRYDVTSLGGYYDSYKESGSYGFVVFLWKVVYILL